MTFIPLWSLSSLRSIPRRIAFLFWHFFGGPIFGLELKLIRDDKDVYSFSRWGILAAWLFIAALCLFSISPNVPKPVRLGLIAILTSPLLLRGASRRPWLVMEYRGYFATFGVSLIFGFLLLEWGWFAVTIALLTWLVVSASRTQLYTDSVLFWKQATEDCPNPDIMSNYFYSLNKAERFDEVSELYKSLIAEQFPETRTLLINLAAAKFGSGQIQSDLGDAAAIMKKVVEKWPDQCDGWRNLGAIQYYQRQFHAAIVSFNHAVDINEKDGLAWFGLGHCFMETDRPSQAADRFQTAFSLIPQVAQVRLSLMEALLAAGRLDEFAQHDQYLRDRSCIYVTEDMLPDHIRYRTDQN